MVEYNKVIFWDFDGTLAHRNGFFSEVLMQIFKENEVDIRTRVEDIRPYLKDGFPWHYPEKPNPEIFRIGLKETGNPEAAWMVGDNYRADVQGAEQVGIPAVLVRRLMDDPPVNYSHDLAGVRNFIS